MVQLNMDEQIRVGDIKCKRRIDLDSDCKSENKTPFKSYLSNTTCQNKSYSNDGKKLINSSEVSNLNETEKPKSFSKKIEIEHVKTEEEKVNDKINEEAAGQRLQTWRNTLLTKTQQQIIDCVVDRHMCSSETKPSTTNCKPTSTYSQWKGKKEKLSRIVEAMNNNVYEGETYSGNHRLSGSSCKNNECFGQSPIIHKIVTSQKITSTNQSPNDQSCKEKTSSMVVNSVEITEPVKIKKENLEQKVKTPFFNKNMNKTGLMTEISVKSKTEMLPKQIVPESNNLLVLNSTKPDRVDSVMVTKAINVFRSGSTKVTAHCPSLNDDDNTNSTNDNGHSSFKDKVVIQSRYESVIEVKKKKKERNNEVREIKGGTVRIEKPVRACKGVRYKEFMSSNQLGKRRGRHKQR